MDLALKKRLITVTPTKYMALFTGGVHAAFYSDDMDELKPAIMQALRSRPELACHIYTRTGVAEVTVDITEGDSNAEAQM